MTGGPQLRAETLLVYYFRAVWLTAGRGWDSSKEAEVRSIVADILAAAADELAELRHDVNRDVSATDSLAEHLEYRVGALEEVIAAKWSARRWLLRARLGRQLRASVRNFPGATFADKRSAAASADWLA